MRLDAADWSILRDLYRWDAVNLPEGKLRVPLRELAKRTGLHRNTVQTRLAAMRAAGVLEGMVFEPRPAMVGLVRAGTLFDAPGLSRARLDAALAQEPGVSSAVLLMDAVFIHSWHDADEDAAAWRSRMSERMRATRHSEGYRSTDFPPSPADSLVPTPLDVRLMRELRREPGSSLAQVGKRLRVTARTAELRAKRLIESGAGAMVPLLHPARAQGVLLVQYVAWQAGEKARDGLARAFPERIMGPFGRGQIASVAVPLPSVEEVATRKEVAQTHHGVGPLDAYLVRDVVYPSAFGAWLDERFASVQQRGTRAQVKTPASKTR